MRRSSFGRPIRPARIGFLEVQANRRIRFARSSTLEQHERPQQAEPDEARAEPGLSPKDGKDAEAHGANRHERNQNIAAH
jgi:hypothetical protein